MDTLHLKSIDVAPYRLPLTRALGMPGSEVHTREGLILRIASEDGSTGYGEVAPLPGLHEDTLDDARAFLHEHGGSLLGDRPWRRVRDAYLRHGAPRSLVFGLEAGLLSLVASRRGDVPARWMAGEDGRLPERVAVCGLFGGGPDQLEHDLLRLSHFPVVKVKLGRQAADADRAILLRLVEALPEVRLRLDANGRLDVDAAVGLVAEIPRERIEYVEEPTSVGDIARFHDETGLDVALDESLRWEMALPRGVSTLVTKPSLYGGVMECLAWRDRAAAMDRQIVVSSSVESGLGLGFLAQLAAVVQRDGVAAGLGTDAFLAEDIVDPRFDSASGFVGVDDWTGAPSRRFIDDATWTTL